MTQVVQVQQPAVTRPGSGVVSGAMAKVAAELAKFGTVGAMAFIIDVGIFNVLRATMLADSPLTAKGISVVAATTFAYFANRHWTYRDRARTGYRRETLLFFATNAAALLIAWGCLATSHYVLGFDSHLADNISGNIIGVGLGTLFRFWIYRTWVFPEVDDAAEEPELVPAEAR